ncbi:glycosyltransferase involved in cell wall biosynthesis [Thermodesulfitimonas autotrophica]|uniref:Glycosyltransferase involved in cell wall biosynthesis n=2 Tax=Thermodesulfitimonas autotrophica TaxID=1894989 RepID=A0A3N5AXY6_9THEO|nr:glycosyltransferase involved in cell wall biosynthesis [Thermodesulfitimonas autotrophica]
MCMIVRDEAQNLPRCLQSAAGFVDEIIVIDTGSRDTTPHLAAQYGARVFYLPWPDDFSQARNESLKYATGEWILILDADEELPAETAARLKELAATTGVEAWIFTVVNHIDPATGLRTRHPNLRLFRNRKEYRFEGKVHEQVKRSILRANPGAVIGYSGLIINHYGYNRAARGRRAKTERNIALLHRALTDNPTDSFIHYNLAVSLFALGDYEKAQKHYEAAVASLKEPAGFAPALYRNYAVCLYEMGAYARALEVADTGLAYFPDYPDLYFLKGQVFWDLGLLTEAEACFKKCLRFRQVPPEYPTTEGVTSYLARENLALIQVRAGRYAAAVDFALQAAAENPAPDLLRNLCRFMRQANFSGKEMVTRLTESLGLPVAEAARLLFDGGEYATCLNLLAEETIGNPETTLLRARCFLHLGDFTRAEESLSQLEAGGALGGEILKTTCLARWLRQPPQSAKRFLYGCDEQADPVATACMLAEAAIMGKGAGPPPEAPALQEEILALALAAYQCGGVAVARTICRAAGAHDDARAYLLLGEYALSKGQNREALELLEFALKEQPGDARAHFLYGCACAGANLHFEAFTHLCRAAQLAPAERCFAAWAGEQLISALLTLVYAGLNREPQNTSLRVALFRLAAARRQAARLKEASCSGSTEA